MTDPLRFIGSDPARPGTDESRRIMVTRGPFGILMVATPRLPSDVIEIRDPRTGRLMLRAVNVGEGDD